MGMKDIAVVTNSRRSIPTSSKDIITEGIIHVYNKLSNLAGGEGYTRF
jgi:hypothetical protein